VVRTQVQLTEEQASALKRLAAERGVSMATLVREGVDRVVGEDTWEAKRRRALAVVGKYRSGHTDIARHHDKYLAEDFFDWRS
jgi:hypothetical protein